jgi:amino acid transporter
MVLTFIVNYSLAIIMSVTIFSAMGIDLPTLLNIPLGQPWILIVLNATGSIKATNILVVVVCLLLMFSAVNQVTALSRELWSFARDQGLPFSTWLAYLRCSLLPITYEADMHPRSPQDGESPPIQ